MRAKDDPMIHFHSMAYINGACCSSAITISARAGSWCLGESLLTRSVVWNRPMGDLQIVLTGRKIEAQYVEMKVPLYSYGCDKKIKKALSNLKGIHSVQVDYQQQKVTVWGICNRDDVLAAIRKKRRAARYWGTDEPGPGRSGDTPPPTMMADAPNKQYLAAFTAYRCKKAWNKLFSLIRL